MYSIDVNLLRDRQEFAQDLGGRRGIPGGSSSNLPLILGASAAAAAVGLVLAGSALMAFRNGQLTAEEQQLEDQLTKIAPQLSQLNQLKAEEQRVNAETQALATIFNQIKPWSSTLQDVGNRVPSTLQITKIEQATAPPPAAPTPAASPSPGASPPPTAPAPPPVTTDVLTFSGKSRSFGDVNDFVLTLQQSPFLNNESTKLIQAQRVTSEKGASLVDYKITTALSGVPASELLQELRRNGATGLVSRIDFLKQKGVIKP